MENSMKPSREKIESMKKYKRAQFLYNLVLYSLTTLITFLFVSYPFWLPFTNHFFLVSLPETLSSFFDAKCFFVLGNIIVFILVRESKVATRSSKFLSTDDYDEYVVRSKSFREVIIKSENIGDIDQSLNIEERRNIGNDRNKEEKMTEDREKNIVKRMRKVNNGGTKLEDLTEIPMEELNKRVEDFIRRVNRQRSLGSY